MKPKNKVRRTGYGQQNKLNGKIDDQAFREYQAKVLRSIREDLLAGMTAEQIFKKYEAHAAAALVSSMINPQTVVAAAEKVLDRTQGRPVQKTENTHHMSKLKDEELNALLKSRLAEVTEDEDETTEGVQ
jgi:hypothetical protein